MLFRSFWPALISGGESQVNATLPEIKAGQKVVLPMPSGVRPTDRVQFRLLLEVADECDNPRGCIATVRLRNGHVDTFSLELGRWVVPLKQGGPQELRGEIGGSLVVARGIDELWLHVTTVKTFWLYNLRARIVRLGRRLRILRSVGTRQVAVLRGSFEASIFTSHA